METTMDEYGHFTVTDPLSLPDSFFAELCTLLLDHENAGYSVALRHDEPCEYLTGEIPRSQIK